MKKIIRITEKDIRTLVKECINNIYESVNEYGFSLVGYSPSDDISPTLNTFWDDSDADGNIVLNLNQISDPNERTRYYKLLQNGEITPSQLQRKLNLKVQRNGIDLDTRNTVDKNTELAQTYTTSAVNNRYQIFLFIRDNYNIIRMLNDRNSGLMNLRTSYLNNSTAIRNILDGYNNKQPIQNTETTKNLLKYVNACLIIISQTHNASHRNKSERLPMYQITDKEGMKSSKVDSNVFEGRRPKNVTNIPQKPVASITLEPTDFLLKVAQLVSNYFGNESDVEIRNIIDYYATEYSKTAGFNMNRQNILKNNKNNLSYYKTVVPGTMTDVITLFPFKDFGGTELLKANRLSSYNKTIKDIYKPQKGEDIQAEFNTNSRDKFLNYSIEHAWKVLTRERFIPNYIICVPSTANFNEEYIAKLSSVKSSVQSYNAFIVKNWLNFRVNNEARKRIEKYLSYLQYTNPTDNRFNNTVDNVMRVLARGVSNTALWMVSNVLNEELFSQTNINEKYYNAFVKYFIFKLSAVHPLYNELLNTTIQKDSNIKQPIPGVLTPEKEKTIITRLQEVFEPYLNGKTPLRVNISQIKYKKHAQAMTSLIPSGNFAEKQNKNDKTEKTIAGQLVRPLVVDVYIINEPQYELTVDGKRMMEEMRFNQDNALNEKKRVELAHQKILIFDDDIDTGTSLKLTVGALNNALSEYGINNTYVKCLTLFGKTCNKQAMKDETT